MFFPSAKKPAFLCAASQIVPPWLSVKKPSLLPLLVPNAAPEVPLAQLTCAGVADLLPGSPFGMAMDVSRPRAAAAAAWHQESLGNAPRWVVPNME